MLLCVPSCWDPGFLGTSLKNGLSSQCPMDENASFPCIKCQAGYIHKSKHDKLLFVHLSHVSPELASSILASNRRQVTETKTAGSSHLSICATFEICQLQTRPARNGNPLQRFDHGESKKDVAGEGVVPPPFQAWF